MSTALPSGIAYALPTAQDLPSNRVDWQLDPARAVLLIHDMQQHFLNPFDAAQQPASQLTDHIVQLRSVADAQGIPVVYTAQPPHQQAADRALLNDFWGAGIGANEEAAQVVSPLAPRPADTVLTKWRYSAFQRTDLLERLRAAGRDQLIICGVYAHIGCQVSAADAFMYDIQAFVVADAVGDFTAEHHAQALAWVAGRCGVVATLATVLEQLGAGASSALDTGSATASVAEDAAAQTLREIIADLLYCEPSEVLADVSLVDQGLDSIRLMDVIEQLRGHGYNVKFEDLAQEQTLAKWAHILTASKAKTEALV